MSSLFRPDELLSVPDFLRWRFGKDLPAPHEINQWRMAEIRQFLDSPHFAIRNYFVTEDNGQLVKMRPYVGQAILSVCLQSQRSRELPQSIVEIKPRQVGWTSWNLGEALWNSMHANRRSLILVDQENVANEVSRKLGTMINGLPRVMQPKRRIQNMKHFVFDNPNLKERINDPGLNSAIQVTVPSSFRGATPSMVIVSEFAFMDDERKAEVTQGLLSAMHLDKTSCIIIDTTPNGYDEFYWPMVEEAMHDNPKWIKRILNAKHITAEDVLAGKLGEPDDPRGYVPATSFWHMHEAYTCRNDNPRGELPKLSAKYRAEIEADLGKNVKYGGAEEDYLRERWDLSIERMYWRRRKIDRYKLPTPELKLITFRQEYASDIESAFVEYGNSAFDRESLSVLKRQERHPIAEGCLREVGGKIGVDTTFLSDWLSLRIYAPPEQGEQYTIGVDTQTAYESTCSDYDAACVVRYRDNKVVAVLSARLPEHELRKQVYLLYKWYFNAYTAVETKGKGYSLIRGLIDMGMRNFYSWKRTDKEFAEPTLFPGWDTNAQSRPIMDDTLVELICARDPATNEPTPNIIVPDEDLLNQLMRVVRGPTGAIKATSGHDDLVDALAIALCAARDPWGGMHKARRENEVTREDRRSFDEYFKNAAARFRPAHRNRPSLEEI